MPALGENVNYVHTRVQELAPGADADAEFDPKEREAWLDRLWSYAQTLSPSFNSLKASILFQRLQFDRPHGVYDKARFLEYLKLPRRLDYVSPRWIDRIADGGQFVDLNADVTELLRSGRKSSPTNGSSATTCCTF